MANFRRCDGGDPLSREAALARIRQARWVFAGPGSPTYTLRQWAGTEIPDLLADKLRHGGVVNFASAAALTLGAFTVPVYEIYKVGADPAWEPGLDLLGPLGLGLHVAVIPHYDNAEGGNHDTRFCYLGERRLRLLEALLPPDTFVLGIDEHTGCLLDCRCRHGRADGGGSGPGDAVPAPRAGPRSGRGGTGDHVAESTLWWHWRMRKDGEETPSLPPPAGARRSEGLSSGGRGRALLARFWRRSGKEESAFRRRRRRRRDVGSWGWCRAISLAAQDDALAAWGADTLQSDEQDRGRAAVQATHGRGAGRTPGLDRAPATAGGDQARREPAAGPVGSARAGVGATSTGG